MSDTSAFGPPPETTETTDTDEAENEQSAEATEPATQNATKASPAQAEEDDTEDEKPKLVYANAGAWVNGWLLPRYRRALGGGKRRWDPNWWRYEEAGGALEALWQAWEHLRLEPGTGIAVFYRDYFYPIMDQITAPDGPFWNYYNKPDSVPGNEIPPAWDTTSTPRGWFREAGHPRDQ